MILVSILINNYNYGEFLRDAISSALNQDYPSIEVIVVDDGSSDGSLKVIEEFGDRITAVLKTNGGQGSAYNSGFQVSRGDVILFLDSDDVLYGDAIRKIISNWDEGVSKVQFALDIVDRAGKPTGKVLPRKMHDASALFLCDNFGAYASPPGSGNAYSRTYLSEIMPLQESRWRRAADSIPILMAPYFGRIVSLTEPCGAYRVHNEAAKSSLFFNNAPSDVWGEYKRITDTKRYFGEMKRNHGRRTGVGTFYFAPWEARMAVICARFGDVSPNGRHPRLSNLLRKGIFGKSVRSVAGWPESSALEKFFTIIWMIGVFKLPRKMAFQLAMLNKK